MHMEILKIPEKSGKIYNVSLNLYSLEVNNFLCRAKFIFYFKYI